MKHVGEVDYLIDIHDRRRKRKFVHVNMLKLFNCSTETIEIDLWTEDQLGESDSDMLEEDVPAPINQPSGQPVLGPQLLDSQCNQLQNLNLMMCFKQNLAKQP